jgi:hypothetical protein
LIHRGGLQKFWEKTPDWFRPGEEAIPLHEARVSLAGNQPVLDLFMYVKPAVTANSVSPSKVKEAKPKRAQKLAPGHYQSGLPPRVPATIELAWLKTDAAAEFLCRRWDTRYLRPKSELPQPYFNTNLLAKLARFGRRNKPQKRSPQ